MSWNLRYSIRNFALAYAAWWLVWLLIHAFILHRMGLSWKLSFGDAAISSFLLALVCLSAVILYRFYQPGLGQRLFRLVFAVSITALFCTGIKWILLYFFPGDVSYTEFVTNSIPIRFGFSFLMLSFVSVLNWLWNVIEDQQKESQRKNQTEQLAREAELAKLRQQLQPHFLFNSLNSISALAGSKPDLARKMIQQLSDFLRGTLRKDENQIISLKEDMEHLELYLDIEKVRFGHRMNVTLELDEKAMDAKIPPLLLQPVVENAIKFGLYGTVDEVTIMISSMLSNNYLVLEVRNPFDEKTLGASRGTGFGLSSIQRRLFLLYSRNDLLSTEKTENTFVTRLKIPQTS